MTVRLICGLTGDASDIVVGKEDGMFYEGVEGGSWVEISSNMVK